MLDRIERPVEIKEELQKNMITLMPMENSKNWKVNGDQINGRLRDHQRNVTIRKKIRRMARI